MNDFREEIRKIPPVTRFLLISLLGVSLPVFMNVVPAYKVIYHYELVFKQLQIWRLYTTFFLGSKGIPYIFELVMVYRFTSQLEGFDGPYYLKSADLAYQTFVAAICIIIASLPVNSFVLFRPFLLCLAYIYSALAPLGAQTSIMGLVTLPVSYTPWIMLGFELLNGGPTGVAQMVPGALVGHLWWWGVWGPNVGGAGGILQEWSIAPQWLRDWMGERGAPRPGARSATGATGANIGSGVHVVPPRRPATAAAAEPAASTSGYNWGAGKKLGS
ncbi:Der1-like family-domain-containing protein [Mycena galericulata]|nr:Der1-like family-domain-containing protein [Mycena galericulata]KAJ7474536.1 Der1-like family-domain-containing protein [Mycena galericulata]KAJ7512387.1 Der1-like family-domain-containing protein [Mycena galericulata]